jgi:hypothetical protein
MSDDKFVGIKFTPDEELMGQMLDAKNHLTGGVERTYLCENCGREETLTEAEAYQKGWDYPPFIGLWGVLSPRTCPDCGIETTAYWAIITQGTENLSEKHQATIRRVMAEPLGEGL